MKIRKLPSLKYLQECFRYEAHSGKLFWNNRPAKHFPDARTFGMWNKRFAGREAFHTSKKGYRTGNLDGAYCAAHRVIWKLVLKKEPPPVIDHKDQNKNNNRWDNLREATKSQNSKNRKRGDSNTSGNVGVHFHRGSRKWVAQLGARNKKRYLGIFNNKEEAIAVWQAATVAHYGEFAV